jgi:uncharacterized phage protein (TIGR01671 family)
MRTIKFRGKIVGTGEWTYGNLLVANNTYSIFDSESYATHEVTPESVGQFTEIYDSTDEEIYEGDIVRTTLISNISDTDYPKIKEVKFHPWYGWRFGADYIRYGFSFESPEIKPKERVEVIGNIYDNPNLLKTKK